MNLQTINVQLKAMFMNQHMPSAMEVARAEQRDKLQTLGETF